MKSWEIAVAADDDKPRAWAYTMSDRARRQEQCISFHETKIAEAFTTYFKKDYQFGGWFRDEYIQGDFEFPERKAGKRLTHLLRKGDVIIVRKMASIGTKLRDFYRFKTFFVKRGVKFCVVEMGTTWPDPPSATVTDLIEHTVKWQRASKSRIQNGATEAMKALGYTRPLKPRPFYELTQPSVCSLDGKKYYKLRILQEELNLAQQIAEACKTKSPEMIAKELMQQKVCCFLGLGPWSPGRVETVFRQYHDFRENEWRFAQFLVKDG